MIGDPVAITYNAVVKNLVKVNQDNYGADYYLEDGLLRYKLKVRHTIPKTGAAGESHLCRLDVEHYDATTGALVRVASCWAVIRTDSGIQDSTSSDRSARALKSFFSDANILKLIARES